jgi:pilus assembly protein FimV
MADAIAEKTKIKDDEFDIHGDLAGTEPEDKAFVVLYDSAESEPKSDTSVEAPTLEDLDESQVMAPSEDVHPEDAYIDDILSSDDIEEPADLPPVVAETPEPEDDDGPITLSNEELDGILDTGPAEDEEFHPDFPVESDAADEHDFTPPEHDESPAAIAPPADHGFDEDELPIALSDEDLDEILLEEEGVPPIAAATAEPAAPPVRSPSPAATPVEAPPAQSGGMFGDDLGEDEEPIALSDDELDNILADAEAGHAEALPALADSEEDEILTLDEDPDLALIDDAAPTEALPESQPASFFDSDEDEPITLSDEELDGILSTAPEEEMPAQSEEVALGDLPNDGVVEVEDDEPIALSHEELDGILMDTEEQEPESILTPAPQEGIADLPPDTGLDESPSVAQNDFFDTDEDEPIALSADELDGIVATATEEDAPVAEEPAPEAEFPADSDEIPAIDERYADVDQMAATDDAEDDGPIALSADELDGIVADAHEVTPEAPMVGLSPHDTGVEEPSLADNTDKPATVFEEDLEASTLIHEDAAAPAAEPAPDTEELKSVMTYLDNLLGELPDDVIEKFAQSDYFKLYQKIMDKLGL